MATPPVHETSDGRPLLSQGPGSSESPTSLLSEAMPSPRSQDTSDFIEPEVSGSAGRGRCFVEVKDGNGNFQSWLAHICEEPQSLVTRIFVRDIHRRSLPLPPPLAIRPLSTPRGLLQLTEFVNVEVRIPQFDIPLTNLAVAVLDQEHASHGPHVFLGKKFQLKTGRFLSPVRSTPSEIFRREQDDPGDAGNDIRRLPPEMGDAISSGNPLIFRSGAEDLGGGTSIPGLRGRDAAGAGVGPVDLDRLNPPGPNMDRRPSLVTTRGGETPIFTVRDPVHSSAPTSILLDETTPPSDESKKFPSSETISGMAGNSEYDGLPLAVYRTGARLFCSSPTNFP